MSKMVTLPLAALAAPAINLLVSAGNRAAMVVKRGKQLWDDISPQDRKFLLPFGADGDRARWESASVNYYAMEGIDFESRLPDFNLPGLASSPYLPAPAELSAITGAHQRQAVERLEAEARALGFTARQSVSAPTPELIAIDLTSSTGARQNEPEPILVQR